jgi:hypothetical protein
MPLFRCAVVFSMLAAFTVWAALDNAAGAQPPGKQPENSKSQKKGDTQGKGKGKGQGKTGGPKHEFAGPAPAHLVDLILSRPTDRSITASVMAYTDLEARIDFGSPARERMMLLCACLASS